MYKLISVLIILTSTSALAAEVCEVGTKFANYQGKFVAALRCTDSEPFRSLKIFYRADGLMAQDNGKETCATLGLTCGDVESKVATFEAEYGVLIKKALLDAGYIRQSSSSCSFETYIKP